MSNPNQRPSKIRKTTESDRLPLPGITQALRTIGTCPAFVTGASVVLADAVRPAVQRARLCQGGTEVLC